MVREDLQDEIPLEENNQGEQKKAETDNAQAQPAKAEEPKAEQPIAKQEEEDFEKMLDEYFDGVSSLKTGEVVKATVVDVQHDFVLVDMGIKSEAAININEFTSPKGDLNIKVGDEIDVYVVSTDSDIDPETGESGELRVSKRRADIIRGWEKIEEAFNNSAPIVGTVTRAVKGGLIVTAGVRCFMPMSQIALERIHDPEAWIGKILTAKILEINKEDNRVILSRRQLMAEEREKKKTKLFASLKVDDIIEGEVRRVMDYGAFVDIGGVDGLLHQDEILYERVDPKKYFKEGDKVKVKVIDINKEGERISLSIKRMRKDPWEEVEKKYPVGSVAVGEVVSLLRFGALVKLEEGVRGMIHISDMSWGLEKKNIKEFVSVGSVVRTVVTKVNTGEKKISLSLRQVTGDPWDDAEMKFPIGSLAKGTVTNLTKNVAFVRLSEYFEGVIESRDLSWDKKIKDPAQVLKKGDEIEAVVIHIDKDRRRFQLGLKQKEENPLKLFTDSHKEGSVVSGKVLFYVPNTAPNAAIVELAPHIEGRVHVSQVARERIEDITQELKEGETYTFVISKINMARRSIDLSRKDYLIGEERKEMDKYISKEKSSVGTNLGDLLKQKMGNKENS